jgi:nucleotide-binding universal stress UspA family protein
MPCFRTILVAADFSANSVAAFRVACAMAVEAQTRLIVLHVVAPGRHGAERGWAGPAVAGAAQAPGAAPSQDPERPLRAAYSPNRAIAVEYRLTEGDPARAIIRVADDVAADLIVVGTHGRTGLRRLLAGSVAATVLHKANRGVLALRANHHQHQLEGIRVILHPTDFSRASGVALHVARSLAQDQGARLIVLHVVRRDPHREGRMPVEIDTREEQHSLEVIRRRIDGPELAYPVETRLVRGLEAEEILRAAQDPLADLIVMGSHGRGRLGRLLMGSTSEAVVPKADCPVLIVKAPPSEAAPTPGRVAVGASLRA